MDERSRRLLRDELSYWQDIDTKKIAGRDIPATAGRFREMNVAAELIHKAIDYRCVRRNRERICENLRKGRL